MTFNVTAVNDAPAAPTRPSRPARIRPTPSRQPTSASATRTTARPTRLPAVKITTLPAAGTLTNNGVAVTAGQSSPSADIAAGSCKFTPAANANGTRYASFTFQVQDNGGTANGGVDLDPTPNTITVNVNSVNDAPLARAARSAWPTARPRPARSTRSRRPTSASPIPATARPTAFLAVKITTPAGAGTLSSTARPSWPASSIPVAQPRRPDLHGSDATAPTPASPSRCRTTAARPTAASISIVRRDDDLHVRPPPVNDAPAGADNTVTTLEDTAYTVHRRRLRLHRPQRQPGQRLPGGQDHDAADQRLR